MSLRRIFKTGGSLISASGINFITQSESKKRFPHPHSPDYDGGEIYSPINLNRETPAING
jgi:hypothetical protein